MSGVRSLYRGPSQKGPATGASAPIRVDDVTGVLKTIPSGSGTTEVDQVDVSSVQTLTNKTLTAPVINSPVVVQPLATITGDGAIPITAGATLLTKGSAAAITVAAPGATGIGVVLVITTGSDFAHVVTFTGSTLKDGTTGAKITWTAAAFIGSSITVMGVTATQWVVISKNLGTVA